jgi:hypothetical protein
MSYRKIYASQYLSIQKIETADILIQLSQIKLKINEALLIFLSYPVFRALIQFFIYEFLNKYWVMPLIPATLKVGIGKIAVQGQPRQNVGEILSQPKT